MKKQIKKLVALTLTAAVLLSGCTGNTKLSDDTEELTQNVTETKVTEQKVEAGRQMFDSAYAEFAVELLKSGRQGESNTMVSPISVFCAMMMAANGAGGETLEEMEQVLGKGMDLEELNYYLNSFLTQLPQSEDAKLKTTNSIWLKDELASEVKNEFLTVNKTYFGAEIFSTAFNQNTKRDVNRWVNINTDGMIKEILDKVKEDDFMYLVNAAAFDAKWQQIYEAEDVRDGGFTGYSGEKSTEKMMHSWESVYLNDEAGGAKGFVKPYREGYSMVFLLPDENMDIIEYVSSLSGEKLMEILNQRTQVRVQAMVPKFTSEYSVNLNEALNNMGMKSAFDGSTADFSNMVSDSMGQVSIDRVLHRTKISVGEEGTKAGAATAVVMKTESAMEMLEYESVLLNRPFIYAIIENHTNLPIFIGTVMELKSE